MKRKYLITLFCILFFLNLLMIYCFIKVNFNTKIAVNNIYSSSTVVNKEIKDESINNLVTTSIYEENILNRAVPVLKENMIPIIYENGNWKKADITTKWYSYEELKWANVMIPLNEKIEYYNNAENGTIINDDDVLGYFVWIPRFEYKLFNVNYEKVNEQMIDIKFVSKEEKKHIDIINGEYFTHPTFTAEYSDGSIYEINGFWIAKFEPSLSLNKKVEIKANKPTLVNINTSKMWNYSINISKDYNIDISSRMITNMEWGAIAYLSYSQFSKQNNSDFTGNNRNIFLNSAMGNEKTWNNVQTGCSSGKTTGVGSYNCPYNYDIPYYGTGASSTGTVYGIYDLAGGSWECVMGIISDYPIKKNIGGYSGYVSGEKRYYTLYENGSMYNYSRGLIGDATRETLSNKIDNKSWNGNLAYFATSSFPWIKRGGTFRGGGYSGLFDYGITDALPRGDKTFRVILSEY